METAWIIGGIVAAYMLGAVPFAYLVARSQGVDIRTVGSGNVGATNVFRAVGKGWGVLTFALDVLKGAIPAGLFVWGIARLGGPSLSEVWKLGMGLAAIAGHNWPVFLGFKGGKGVATGAGVLLAAAPVEVAIGLAAWIALFLSLRYVSLASIGAAAAVVVAGWLTRPETGGWTFPTVLTLLGALTIWRHRSNLRRLREGTEHRFALGRGAGKRETTP